MRDVKTRAIAGAIENTRLHYGTNTKGEEYKKKVQDEHIEKILTEIDMFYEEYCNLCDRFKLGSWQFKLSARYGKKGKIK